MSIITDEMVEVGLKGSCMYYDDGTCAKPCYACRQDVCNALAAVAPAIRAAALEEAAKSCNDMAHKYAGAGVEQMRIAYGDAAEIIRALKERGDE